MGEDDLRITSIRVGGVELLHGATANEVATIAARLDREAKATLKRVRRRPA